MAWNVWIEDKPSGKFLVRRRHSSGRSLPSKSCSTKSLANELKKKWLRELELQDLGMVDPRRSVHEAIDQFIEELERNDQLPYTKHFRTIKITYLADKKMFSELTRESILLYRTEIIKKLRPATVRSYLRHLAAWLSWCVNQGFLAETPFKHIELPSYTPQPKFLTDDEIMAIDRAAKGPIKLAWRLAYTTGLRQKNVRQLRGDQIEDGMIAVQRTKGKKPISAPLNERVLALLPKPLPAGPLFPEWAGDPDGRYALDRAFRCLRKAAKVRQGITWHMARHTFVKKGLQSGLTTFEVMGFTGHVSPQSMAPYAHFEMSRLKDRHKMIKFPKAH